MLGIILTGIFFALLILIFGKFIKTKLSYLLPIFPGILFLYFAQYIPTVINNNIIHSHTSWVPSYGVNLNFRLDGLSLLFSLLITGIGTLIFIYASKYMRGVKYADRFFAYLCIFMSAMLGIVLSENLISLFLFWELTSISSFFLIGFNNEQEKSRKNAQLALAITGLGGFFLLCAFIIIGNIVGSYEISDMLNSSEFLKNSLIYPILIACIFIGAFTKSAQFPFHFWLPGAMSAPTPVSAYLHSATMVKAGIYLIARFTPTLGFHPYWNGTLLIVGAITLMYAALNSLYKTDLKAVLAYSTIAALGMLFLLFGIGTDYAILAAITFILIHAFYKAALFMIVGIIDHEAHTRDITVISGLRKVMPAVAITAALAAFSNAGLPLTFGFIGKDLIYEATLNHPNLALQIPITILVVIANIILLYAGFQAGVKPFIGKLPSKFEKITKPNWRLWFPAFLLAIAGIFYGIFPQIIDNILIKSAFNSVYKLAYSVDLKLWHGINLVLLLSVITLVAGVILFYFRKQSHAKEDAVAKLAFLSPLKITENIALLTKKFAMTYTKMMHNGYLRAYLITIIVFFIGIVGYKFFTDVEFIWDNPQLTSIRFYEIIVFSIITIAILITVSTSSRLTAIVSLSVIGLCICLIYVFYGAPDLAMTQFIIDTLTVVLFVLVLFKLPPFLKFNNKKIQIRDAIISSAFGILIALITLQALLSPADKAISKYYAENAYLMAKGKNVVNVILVDFRGFDTMIETIVLSIAAIGVYSLLKLQVKSSEKE